MKNTVTVAVVIRMFSQSENLSNAFPTKTKENATTKGKKPFLGSLLNPMRIFFPIVDIDQTDAKAMTDMIRKPPLSETIPGRTDSSRRAAAKEIMSKNSMS